MIMTNPSGYRLLAYSPSTHLKLLLVDVAEPARILANGHLNGPASSMIQAAALAATALLGGDLGRPEETITFQFKCDGPIKGFLMEASGAGGLRGYVEQKVLEEYDTNPAMDLTETLGRRAAFRIMRSFPGALLAQSQLQIAAPVRLDSALEHYYSHSEQRDTAVRHSVHLSEPTYLDCARGLLLERLPEGSQQLFQKLQKALRQEGAPFALESSAPLAALSDYLGISDFEERSRTELRFACSCSSERVTSMLEGLPTDELRAMASASHPASIYCHMCGRGWSIPQPHIEAILKARGSR